MRLEAALAALAITACGSPPSEPPRAASITIPSALARATAVAEAQGAPAPPAPKSGWEAELEHLRPISVRVRFPDIETTSMGQAARIEQVRAAVERVTPDMFVHYAANGADDSPVSPWQLDDGGHFNFIDILSETPTAAPLAKYGRVRLGTVEDDSLILALTRKDDASPASLPDQTPGLVWEVSDDGIVFVAFDGETYLLARGTRSVLEPRAGPPARWPKPVSDPFFGVVAVGQRGFASSAAVGRAFRDFAVCVGRAWPPVQKKLADKSYAKGSEIAAWIAGGHGHPSIEAIVVQRGCKREILAWEMAFAGLIEERRQDRLALFEKFKTRAASLGVDR